MGPTTLKLVSICSLFLEWELCDIVKQFPPVPSNAITFLCVCGLLAYEFFCGVSPERNYIGTSRQMIDQPPGPMPICVNPAPTALVVREVRQTKAGRTKLRSTVGAPRTIMIMAPYAYIAIASYLKHTSK